MDLIGELIKQKREFFSFLNNGLSTQIVITLSFITRIIFNKKIPRHFNFKKNTKALYITFCDYLVKQIYNEFKHTYIFE